MLISKGALQEIHMGIEWHSIVFSGNLVFVVGTLNCAMYIQNIIQPFLIPFLQQLGNMHFQSYNACPYEALVNELALQDFRLLPLPACLGRHFSHSTFM